MQSVIGKFFVLLFIPLIWIPINCGSSPYMKKDTENKKGTEKKVINSQNPYFPLSSGNRWEYVNEEPGDEKITYKVEIVSEKNEGDDKIFEISSFPFFSKEEKPERLRVKSGGAVYLIDKDSKESLIIPETENLKKDFTWQFGRWRGSVASTNETVKTEYGTFENCMYLNYSIYFTFSAVVWLAKDTGIVKWGYNRTNPPTLKPEYYVLQKLNLIK